MGVGEQQHVEARRLARLAQREVDRVRERPARRHAAVAQRELRRRPFGLMDVIEARQHGAVFDRHRIAGRLDHENDIAVLYRQSIAALRVGLHHLATVGHEHAGNSRIERRTFAVAGTILEYHAGRNRRDAIRREGSVQASSRRRQRDDRAAASYDIAPSDRVVHPHVSKPRPTGATDGGRHGLLTRGRDGGLPASSDSDSTFLRRLDDSKPASAGAGGLQACPPHR